MKWAIQIKLPCLLAVLINIYGVCIELHSHMSTITFSHWLISIHIYCYSYVISTVSESTWWRNGKMKTGTCKQLVDSQQQLKKQLWLFGWRGEGSWLDLSGWKWRRPSLISDPWTVECMYVFQKKFPRVPFESSSVKTRAGPLWATSAKPPGVWLMEAAAARASQPVDKTRSMWQWWCFMSPIRFSLHLALPQP